MLSAKESCMYEVELAQESVRAETTELGEWYYPSPLGVCPTGAPNANMELWDLVFSLLVFGLALV